jgi:hypothetical protein
MKSKKARKTKKLSLHDTGSVFDHDDPGDIYNDLIESYTTLPPFPFKKKLLNIGSHIKALIFGKN